MLAIECVFLQFVFFLFSKRKEKAIRKMTATMISTVSALRSVDKVLKVIADALLRFVSFFAKFMQLLCWERERRNLNKNWIEIGTPTDTIRILMNTHWKALFRRNLVFFFIRERITIFSYDVKSEWKKCIDLFIDQLALVERLCDFVWCRLSIYVVYGTFSGPKTTIEEKNKDAHIIASYVHNTAQHTLLLSFQCTPKKNKSFNLWYSSAHLLITSVQIERFGFARNSVQFPGHAIASIEHHRIEQRAVLIEHYAATRI